MLEANNDPDLHMMQRCIALAESAGNEGEYPFAAVIASNGAFLCESANRVKRDHDVNSHAEIVAISKAQLIRGAHLTDCTIYSTVEPCAQCAYAIREARIGKVVYGLRSPLMGGALPMEHPLRYESLNGSSRGLPAGARDRIRLPAR